MYRAIGRRGGPMPSLPEEAFRRTDEAPDEEFYRTPRLVTHIDNRAIAAVTQLYREFFPPGGDILDRLSSWISHLPPEIEYRRVNGLGMNEAELQRNESLDSYVVQNLNINPRLPFGDAEFDGCGICVSIDYLTRPIEVLREVGRVLKVGGPTIITRRPSPSGTNWMIMGTCGSSKATWKKPATSATAAVLTGVPAACSATPSMPWLRRARGPTLMD
jgi:hypothetical protein